MKQGRDDLNTKNTKKNRPPLALRPARGVGLFLYRWLPIRAALRRFVIRKGTEEDGGIAAVWGVYGRFVGVPGKQGSSMWDRGGHHRDIIRGFRDGDIQKSPVRSRRLRTAILFGIQQ